MIRFFARLLRATPRAIERLHLEWALSEISPLHEDVPFIVHRLNELRRMK